MRLVLRAFWGWLCICAILTAQPSIRLKTRDIDTYAASTRGALRFRGAEPRHVLLRFGSEGLAGIREELDHRGIHILRWLPDGAAMVSVPSQAALTGLNVPWIGRLESTDKLSPALATETPPGYIAVFHPDVTNDEARSLLTADGWEILENPDLLTGQWLIRGAVEKLAALTEWDEVAYVFPASWDLVLGNRVTACAGPLTELGTVAEYATASKGWSMVNGKVELGYVFGALTARIADSTIRTEVARALAEWSKYAPVDFVLGTDSAAARTIAILFATGAHGDSYPFDGAGKVLAHTFYPVPPNSEPLAGDMHLDDDEDWHVGSTTDLFSVVLHELGHALGLAHSDNPAAVMYPYYRFNTGLNADDIAGIRSLYGSRDTTTSTTTTTTTTTTPTTTTTTTTPTTTTTTTTTSDGSGTSGTSGSTDTTQPALAIQKPAFTIVSTTAATITMAGTASDNVAVTEVKWTTSGGGSGTATGTTSWTAESIPLLVGTNTVIVRAYDAAGNSAWRAVSVVRR